MRADGGWHWDLATEEGEGRRDHGDWGEAESQYLVKHGKVMKSGEAGLPLLALTFRGGCGQASVTQTCGLLWRMWVTKGLSCE